MPWLQVEENSPQERGLWQLCRIGGKNGYRLPLRIGINVIADTAGRVYKPSEVEWLDEPQEPNQDAIWDEALIQFAVVNGYSDPQTAKEDLISRYNISRK